MNTPLLTIAIPTCNGIWCLPDCISSVKSEILENDYQDLVEVVIIDNGSSQNIQPILEEILGSQKVNWRLVRNLENIGYDRNIHKLFQFSKGDFVKLLADDDAFLKGGLKQLVEALRDHTDEVDVIATNFDIYDQSLQVKQYSLDMSDRVDSKIIDGNEFLKNSKGRFGQVSSLAFRRASWLKENPEQGFGSQYIHVYMMLKILVHGKALLQCQPTLKIRSGSLNFEKVNSDVITVPQGAIKIFREFLGVGFEDDIIRSLLNAQHSYVLRRLFSAKKNGLGFSLNLFKVLILFHYDYPKFWLIYLPFYLIPNIFIPFSYIKRRVEI